MCSDTTLTQSPSPPSFTPLHLRPQPQPQHQQPRARARLSNTDSASSTDSPRPRNRLLTRLHDSRRPQSHHAGPTPPGFPSSPIPSSISDDDEPLLVQTKPLTAASIRERRITMSTPASSSSAEKHTRRGLASGPHVLRAGGPRSNLSSSSKRIASGSSELPAPPPKAAMASANANGSTPDEALESSAAVGSGGAPLKSKHDKDTPRSRSSSLRGKDVPTSGSAIQSDSATAVLLRERDDRIATLEQELEVMEGEFRRELDKLAKTEAETATFWQAKHSTLHQQFLRADTDLRLLRAQIDDRERERDELRNGWEVLRRTLAERESETRGLRQQVRGLKEFVSTSTRMDSQQAATDESLAETMARLANGLQNWVITNFRRARLRPLEELDEAVREEAGELLPMFEELAASGKKVHLLQSIVSRVLVEEIFDVYYAGMTNEQMGNFQAMEELLGSFAASDEAVNQWRASTLALVHREAQSQLGNETVTLIDSLTSKILRLLDSILQPPATSSSAATTNSNPNGNSSTDPRDTSLRTLINSALDFSRLLSVQRAILRVYMPPILPHQRVLFDAATMEDVGGEDEDALDQRDIACIVFPGLMKRGDESGEHLQVYRNVVAKARVLCAEEA